MNKFLIACCVFSFICGMFATLQIEKQRGCKVEIRHGQEIFVYSGKE
jgi:hypothetical protein